MSLSLILNRFHTLLWCFDCYFEQINTGWDDQKAGEQMFEIFTYNGIFLALYLENRQDVCMAVQDFGYIFKGIFLYFPKVLLKETILTTSGSSHFFFVFELVFFMFIFFFENTHSNCKAKHYISYVILIRL